MGNLLCLAMIEDPTISEEQRKQEKAYKKYVDEHISNVKTAWILMKQSEDCMKYIRSLDNDYNGIIATVDSLIDAHDMSKYGIEE